MSSLTFGAVVLGVTALVALGLFFKPTISTWLAGGDTITAEFPENYLGKLFSGETTVKLSGLESGRVTGVDYTDHHTAVVSMKVDDGVLDKIGPQPSATITPRTLLGGLYSIELVPGGGHGSFPADGRIPLQRTSLPVGLDRILEAVPRPTRQAVQGIVSTTNQALAQGGEQAVGNLLTQAPDTLRPTNDVLQAARGTRPGVDLPQLVTNLESTASVLTAKDGQLDGIVDDLDRTTQVLASSSKPLADSISTMPDTLRITRESVTNLGGTLDKLRDTASSFRPAAQKVGPLLDQLDPVLVDARPVVHDLRPVLDDARPAVGELVPTADRATGVLDDVRGPTLQRVQGPVLDTLLNTYRGTGPYQGSGGGFQADHTFYQELGYLVTNLDRGSMTQDKQGSLLGFQVGAGPLETVGGLRSVSLPDLVDQLGRAGGLTPSLGNGGATGPLAAAPTLGRLGQGNSAPANPAAGLPFAASGQGNGR
ncbi:MCE family protein [Actinomycetospora endophytica]|uniref:MCE family protein n=1 Tax=Actinomycetospora endophytica TaxID=2291215 RepID=A0ABS8P8Y5_9PSEU|nr:MlaD family protein [Actinomycetospora endophytica]MCD2194569.1 MCE family protein [Actinomycetospora endophytica]